MPKTKLGTEIKNYGRKRLKSGLSCSLTPSLESEDVKTFVKETLASGDKGNILLTTAIYGLWTQNVILGSIPTSLTHLMIML